MKNLKNTNKGITLIALIITIIVMLILVSVTISMAVNGGLFEYAGKAVSDTQNAIDLEQQLANGEIKIGDTWYNSMDDYLKGVESVKSLQEKHEFTYYSSLSKAVTDVNNNTRENADAEKENAVAGIYTEDGKHTVVLLEDTTENTKITVTKAMIINLGGKKLTFTNTKVGIATASATPTDLVLDGRLNGSTIEISGETIARTVQIFSGECSITGGNYISYSQGGFTDNSCICVGGTGYLEIANATIRAVEYGNGICLGIIINPNCSAIINNCNIKAFANYLNDSSYSKGITNNGNLIIKDSYVMGTFSGMNNNGTTLKVDGGVFEGYGRGGIDFDLRGNTAYVRNATIRECAMPEGYTSTVASNNTGFIVGVGSNVKVYMDNCEIYGSENPILIEGSNNNILYISNSKINTDKQINIGTNHKLYIGKGNNFTAENTNNPTAVVKTEEVYIQEN